MSEHGNENENDIYDEEGEQQQGSDMDGQEEMYENEDMENMENPENQMEGEYQDNGENMNEGDLEEMKYNNDKINEEDNNENQEYDMEEYDGEPEEDYNEQEQYGEQYTNQQEEFNNKVQDSQFHHDNYNNNINEINQINHISNINNINQDNQVNQISNLNNIEQYNEIDNEQLSNQMGRTQTYSEVNAPIRIKPKFYKLLSEIITNNFIPILNYLDLKDLSLLRGINHLFLALIHEYYQQRLKYEINLIINFQDANKEKTAIFMKNIDSQIPISNKNWLDFELPSVTKKLKTLDRKLVSKLRSIKSIGRLSDLIYAPFCIIFGHNKKLNTLTKNNTWKKTASLILSDSKLLIKIQDLDLENMNDSEMLNAFVFLNLNELDVSVIKKSSSDLAKMVIWCQAVVSYHILIHPYTYRNDKSTIVYGSDVYQFANNMNMMINRFYKFKRFLYNLHIIKIPLADYVFNLQHNRDLPKKEDSIVKGLNDFNIGNILSYLPYTVTYKFMGMNRKFYNGFRTAIDIDVLKILVEIYCVKSQSYAKINNLIPVVYSHNIFSNYFIMIDDILHSNCNELGLNFIPFLSKEQLNDLKKIKIYNDLVVKVCKVFCLICDIKPEKRTNIKGQVEYLWVDKVKLLVISNKILKIMRNVNQLSIPEQRLKIIDRELSAYYVVAKLEEVKKINHGLYQLLVWELYVYEYLKIYNPFDFINQEYIINRYEQEEIELIKYYIEILNYLKYHLKIKYHFSTGIGANSNNANHNFGFVKYIYELKKYLTERGIDANNDLILQNTEPMYTKLATLYFDSKDNIPIGAKPALYAKIMIEILSCRERQSIGPQSVNVSNTGNTNMEVESREAFENEGQLSSIKEENNDNTRYTGPNNANKNRCLNHNFNEQEYGIMGAQSKRVKMLSNNINTSQLYFKNKNEIPISLNDIPNDILVKNILFYLDISSLPKFSLVNKKANQCIKTHIFIRLYFLHKEKGLIENENNDIIQSITAKRYNFYNEYELEEPQKEHAYTLMNEITSDDIMELKQCFRKYNKNYEIYITPLMILLGENASSRIKPDGTKMISFYPTAKTVLFKPNFIRRIRDMELETIPIDRFKTVERLLEDDAFCLAKIKTLSPCLIHLISWIQGVVEFHRVIRKYSLSSYDYDYLSDDEISFCNEMDNIVLLYYKLLRYATKHCKQYESEAKQMMISMDIQ